MDPFTVVAIISAITGISEFVIDRSLQGMTDKNRSKIYDEVEKLTSIADANSAKYQSLMNSIMLQFSGAAKDYANRGREIMDEARQTQEAISARKKAEEAQRAASLAASSANASYVTGRNVKDIKSILENKIGGSING